MEEILAATKTRRISFAGQYVPRREVFFSLGVGSTSYMAEFVEVRVDSRVARLLQGIFADHVK